MQENRSKQCSKKDFFDKQRQKLILQHSPSPIKDSTSALLLQKTPKQTKKSQNFSKNRIY